MKNKMPYEYMNAIAMPIIELLRPRCKRIEPAGSLRRHRDQIGDIEIVAEPLEFYVDMLGNPTQEHSLDRFNWQSLGALQINGHKQKKIILPGNIQIDLFIVTPPAQWGVLYILRTGSDKFSHKMVTEKSHGGYMPSHLHVAGGALWKKNELIPTPEEADIFRAYEMEYIPPEMREEE
jgi:DNA polymerase/3'-5' exonuclease PolX